MSAQAGIATLKMSADHPQSPYLCLEVVTLPNQFSVPLGHLLGCISNAQHRAGVDLLKRQWSLTVLPPMFPTRIPVAIVCHDIEPYFPADSPP